MSERKITVSDGTNFYLIPSGDVDEACADGFYIPSHRGRTIVSDGKDIFEIDLADLADARSDGFYDVLAAELETVRSLGRATVTAPSASVVASVAQQTSASIAAAVHSAKVPAGGGSSAVAELDPDEISEVPGLQADQEPGEEAPLTIAARVHRFFHPDATQRRRLVVFATNTVVHFGVLFIMAAIFLPSVQKEDFLMITSTLEPEIAQTDELEMMELEQPVEISESTAPAETFVDSKVESMDVVDVNINDLDLSSIVTTVDVNSNAPSAKAASEFGGRSTAGRSEMVAKMGGSAASEKAVQQGLKWVETHQLPDGGWSFDHTGGECKGSCSQPGSLKENCRNAATGMAILAMLGAGNTPFEGDFQDSVLKGVQFLLAHSSAAPAGLDLRGQHAGNTGMYCQAIAATALCETLAMLQHEVKDNRGEEDQRSSNRKRLSLIRQLEPAALAGINFIANAQNQDNGSWGYNPGASGDTSILGWQVMALKSAVHAKIPVNPKTVLGANLFLNQVQAENGMYGYSSVENPAPSTTAIGLVCRMLSGMSREEPRLKLGVQTLSALGPNAGNMYYNYYATQVMLHYGGDEWTKWNSVMRDHLVSTQVLEGHAAGSWNISDAHGGAAGRHYMSCLCIMTLEVYYRHLPLYGVPDEADTAAEKSEEKSQKKSADKADEKESKTSEKAK